MRSDKFSIQCTGKGDLLSSASVALSSQSQIRFENCSKQLERQLRDWLDAYFNATPIPFNIPCESYGTPFQQKVWDVLKNIPFGQTKSYADVAVDAEIPKGSRAVGNACGKNRLILFVPCHRVIRSDHSIGGFAVDLAIKQRLLELERSGH